MINGKILTPRVKELIYVRCIKEKIISVNNKNLRYVTLLCETDDDTKYISVNDDEKNFTIKTAYQIEGYFYNKKRSGIDKIGNKVIYDNWKGTDITILAQLDENKIIALNDDLKFNKDYE